jgi:hypothetical protein
LEAMTDHTDIALEDAIDEIKILKVLDVLSKGTDGWREFE